MFSIPQRCFQEDEEAVDLGRHDSRSVLIAEALLYHSQLS